MWLNSQRNLHYNLGKLGVIDFWVKVVCYNADVGGRIVIARWQGTGIHSSYNAYYDYIIIQTQKGRRTTQKALLYNAENVGESKTLWHCNGRYESKFQCYNLSRSVTKGTWVGDKDGAVLWLWRDCYWKGHIIMSRVSRQGIAAEMIHYNVWGNGFLSKGCIIMLG